MRKSIALTANETAIAATARKALASVVAGQGVTIAFQKQDKALRFLNGSFVEVVGSGDKEVVRLNTVDGFRSANLSRIISVTAL